MTLAERFRIAWACEACRFYRRMALALAGLAFLAWIFQ
jgi:hypothetical protein